MIHVLSVIHYPVFGGPHNLNMRIAPVLEELGVRTTVVLPEDEGDAGERLSSAGIQVVKIPLHRVRASLRPSSHYNLLKCFVKEVQHLKKLIANLNVDVVQLNGLINPHAAIAAKGAGVPVVWQLVDTSTPTLARPVMKRLVKRYADVVMSTGLRVAEQHLGSSWDGSRLVTYYPPVDLVTFRSNQEVRMKVRAELGLPDRSLVVGTLGNVNRQKGHENFVRAAAELKKVNQNSAFFIFGAAHNSQPDRIRDLIQLSRGLGLKYGNDIQILNPGTRVCEYLQALDVFWMTAKPKSEGIPTAMEEAMALGLPVVTFDVGSIAELVDEGSSGYLVSKQNPRLISDVTAGRLLSQSARAKLGACGRKIVEERASIGRCAQLHYKAYMMALDQSGVLN